MKNADIGNLPEVEISAVEDNGYIKLSGKYQGVEAVRVHLDGGSGTASANVLKVGDFGSLDAGNTVLEAS